jgi:hypothetical protein
MIAESHRRLKEEITARRVDDNRAQSKINNQIRNQQSNSAINNPSIGNRQSAIGNRQSATDHGLTLPSAFHRYKVTSSPLALVN